MVQVKFTVQKPNYNTKSLQIIVMPGNCLEINLLQVISIFIIKNSYMSLKLIIMKPKINLEKSHL
jgi:hypothetical protein